MAAQLDPDRQGPILELGISPERLTVVEHDPDFARLMAEWFPGIGIIEGDAFDIDRTLPAGQTFSGIISGIPLLNHSLANRRALIESCFARLRPYAPFIQYSYGLHRPVPPPAGFSVRLGAFVWLNVPPAHVWIYRQK